MKKLWFIRLFWVFVFAGIAGLAVTYGLNLNMMQSWVIWNLCNLENRIIAVERILQYTGIPSEPPLVIEANRPDGKWPSVGEVDIQDLQVIMMHFHMEHRSCELSFYLGDFTAPKTFLNRPIFDSGSLRRTHAICSKRSHLQFSWRPEDRHCRENRQRQVHLDSNPLSYYRPDSRSDPH